MIRGQGCRRIELTPSDVHGHDGLAAGDYVAIALIDNGHGIAEADLAKVFEPFFTTRDVGKGTGLGLSMVYGFVKQSNGHIALDSEVGRGTRVMLYLPCAVVLSPAVVPERRQPEVRGAQEIVLVVEDDKLEQGILFLAKPYSRAQLARMLRVALREQETACAGAGGVATIS